LQSAYLNDLYVGEPFLLYRVGCLEGEVRKRWFEPNSTVNPPQKLVEFLETQIVRTRGMVALCHNDLDGLAAGLILKRFLALVFNKTVYTFHSYFGIADNDIECLKRKKPIDVLWVIDKGTAEQFHKLSEYAERIIIIDHHKPEGPLSSSMLVYNPMTLGSKTSPPASFLLYKLVSSVGFHNVCVDFLALVGSRADDAFDPVTNHVQTGMSRFYTESKEKYQPLFKLRAEKPTRFDLERRDCTTLLNQITEVLNCATYARDYIENLKVSGSEFLSNLLSQYCRNLEKSPEILQQDTFNLNSFMELTGDYHTVESVYCHCTASFEKTQQVVKDMKLVKKKNGLSVFLLCGQLPKTAPAVGKIELYEQRAKDTIESGILVLVNEKQRGFTLSTRSVNTSMDLGNFMEKLVRYLKMRFHVDSGIEGGGQAEAAGGFISPALGLDLHQIEKEVRSFLEEYF